MAAASTIRQKLGNAVLSIALFILSGCSETESSQLSANHYQPIDSLMPTEVWLDSALDQLNSSSYSDSSYQLFLSLEPELKNLTLEFANNKELERVELEDQQELKSTLLFDKSRLTYSYHLEKSGRDWIVAYANNKPYAAALNENGQWKAVEPYVVPSDQTLLNKTLSLARQYADLEKEGLYQRRILTDNFEISGEIEKKKALNYRINAKKGDLINVAIENAPEHIFFTFANQATSRMEYKKWSGSVDITGDIIIQVFSAAETPVKDDFTLRVSHQSQVEFE
jgi:hypothetical protein